MAILMGAMGPETYEEEQPQVKKGAPLGGLSYARWRADAAMFAAMPPTTPPRTTLASTPPSKEPSTAPPSKESSTEPPTTPPSAPPITLPRCEAATTPPRSNTPASAPPPTTGAAFGWCAHEAREETEVGHFESRAPASWYFEVRQVYFLCAAAKY